MTTPTSGSGAPWWRDAVIYQIYPKSFADSDGDGVGDLPGITARLDHLVWLGVDAVWLSPFYPSPQADGGYDVSDYCDVDPLLGTLADLDALLDRAHGLGLRVVVDLVPNHSSDEHPWFRAALATGPGSRERDVYVFRRGTGQHGERPPNNWQSIFGGPAWTRVDRLTGDSRDVGEWYLHSFDPKQPDLNWDSPVVRARFEDVLRFWLDRGVDGFRVDVAHGLVKAEGLPDWDGGGAAMVMGGDRARAPQVGNPPTDPVAGPVTDLVTDSVVELGPMFDQEGVHDIYRSWNRLLVTYPGDRAMVGEACVEPAERAARYVRPDEMQQAFNFPYLQCRWDAPALRHVITVSREADGAVGAPTTWVLSNHDVVRHASLLGLPDTGRSPSGIGADDPQPDAELGLRRARAAVLLMLALPGSAYLYQGEELGLPEHTTLPDALRQDPIWTRSGGTKRGRDGCRVPLPWQSDRPGFGFGPTGRTWLPQPADWAALAVDVQREDPGSTLSLYRTALGLRGRLRLGSGDLRWVALDGADPARVLAFRNGDVLVVVTVGGTAVRVPDGGTVLLRSDGPASAGDLVVGPDTTAWIRVSSPDVHQTGT
ncbi:glycoside hydrolase family 13 protein [Cellulomonas aerilata]|uniref:Alpha-glucosidase n=1 Tax=Cellulomonas aerilata TaxID=515326 RepID=A0A512DGU7_9CELL|nr:glycoside hydrolase family 13 protein [Cellulomonas aerilata]GEO35714.1 alpha-glucosidase [Cellulomonas aerilata]